MASRTDYEKGLSDAERGVVDKGLPPVPLFPLLQSQGDYARWKEANQYPVLALLPDGRGIVAPGWVAENEKHRIGQQLAAERASQTRDNLNELVGGLFYGAGTAHGWDADKLSDFGATYSPLQLVPLLQPHPLNQQGVVGAPTNIVWGAPTYQRAVPARQGSSSKSRPQSAPAPVSETEDYLRAKNEAAERARALEEQRKAPARGTNTSIKSAPPTAKKVERGLAKPKPGSGFRQDTRQKRVILDLSKERYVDPVDRELQIVEQQIGVAREGLAHERFTLTPEQWASKRGGLSKHLYNLLERRAALARAKTWPNKAYLEQARIVGVELKNGQRVPANKISSSKKGRIADILELDGTQATMEDLKTDSTQLKSIEGGLRSEQVDAVFRPLSEIGKQHVVEKEIIEFAKKNGGTIIVKGKEVVFGTETTIRLDPNSITAPRVTGYYALPNQ